MLKLSLSKGAKWQDTMKKWAPTCTKLAAWTLTQFERVIFMDSDMIAVGAVDDALYEYSNAPFLACPEVLPPDTLNSGFMVLNPSMKSASILYLSILYLSILYLSILYLSILYLSILYLSILFLSILYLSILFLSTLYLSILYLCYPVPAFSTF